MSETVWTQLIGEVHNSGRHMALAVTGGGTKAISQLLDVAGASRTVLEAVVPYAADSLVDWLGAEPEQWCSETTARQMAMRAWMRARELAPDISTTKLVGIGATASLATDRPKRGEHRIHVALQSECQTVSMSLTLKKGLRDRKKEQWLAAKLILLAVGESCEVDVRAAAITLAGQFVEGEVIKRDEQAAKTEWTELLTGQRKLVVSRYGSPNDLQMAVQPTVVFPGAFNPLHEGHRQMSELAAKWLGELVTFEMSITNVDKPTLDFVEIAQRLANLHKQERESSVVLTDAPTFREKGALFPGCTFVVGADTILRIAEPRYYLGGEDECLAAIEEMRQLGCRFLVFGRVVDGRFQGLGDLELPPALSKLCDEVKEREFREDVSSTALRAENS